MRRPSRGTVLWAAVTLVVVVALAESVAARGGGRGGGGRGGGGRGGGGRGGFNRGGPAAWGTFNQNRPALGMDRGEYDARGPAADGSFGMQYADQGDRQEQRQERREERRDRREDREEDATERREDWEEYAEDYYDEADEGYYGDYYGDVGVYWTLPCKPNVLALGGVVYYICDSTWYIRAYNDGEVVYSEVDPPNEQ